MSVKLSPDLVLPRDAATQTYAFIARKGAGKSYAASKLTEELLLLGAPVVVIDPIGNWYGLRLLPNGKPSQFTIPVFGGLHGDIPIAADQGHQLGKLLVENDLAAVVDVSSFRKADRKRFVADFAEEFFHQSKMNPAPRMLVLEEAQLFAPQHPQGGEERMLGAIEDIVRLGRNFGIGSCMISQRPQSINKEVLNQVEALFVGQLNASHERKAVEAWVMDHKADKKWTEELPSLPVGTMIAWSPQWLKVMKKVKIGKKLTLDASATPELGQQKAFKLAELDVESLRLALAPPEPVAAPGKKATVLLVQDDLQLADLQAQLEATRAAAQRERLFFTSHLQSLANDVGKIIEALQDLGERVIAHPALGLMEQHAPEAKVFFLNERQEQHLTKAEVRQERKLLKDVRIVKPTAEGEPLTGGALRMLQALAAFHPGTMTMAQVARAAKMTPSGGAFSKYWAQLKKGGYIESVDADLYHATAHGLKALGTSHKPVPREFLARVSYWRERLSNTEARMLGFLVDGGRRWASKTELAKGVGMTASGGAFTGALGTLIRNRLVAKKGDLLEIHPWLKGEE